MPDYECKTIDGSIAYFKFLESATAETFMEAFEDFQRLVSKPDVSALVVDVEMKDAWGGEIQELWLQTGAVAESHGIRKWGVRAPNLKKRLTIEYLVRGGAKAQRRYEYFISESLEAVLEWIRGRVKAQHHPAS